MKKKPNELKCRTVFSSLLTLLPILIGISIWDKIPNSLLPNSSISTHINTPIYKILLVFGLPILLMLLNLVCLFITYKDNRKVGQNKKVLNSLFYICPSISIISSIFFYNGIMGNAFNLTRIFPFLLGVIFVLYGNAMPKAMPNSVYGIKTFWALKSDENWTQTHRFGGVLWVAFGLLMLFLPILPLNFIIPIMIVMIAICVASPILFSYCYYKKQVKNGTYIENGVIVDRFSKKQKIISLTVGIIVIASVFLILSTGNVDIVLESDNIDINASYYTDIKIPYDTIEHIEFREHKHVGNRLVGFGSFKLSLGTFQNDEFDNYTCYVYNSTKSCIAIKTSDGNAIINLDSDEETKKLYYELLEKID